MVAIFGLLTDFGDRDPYRGQLASVLLRRNPSCQILDLSHQVDPHNIPQGAFFLRASWPWLPRGCIVLAVVDPGVGSSRDIVLLRSRREYVLAPDNGLLDLLLRDVSPDGLWRLGTKRYSGASSTFHGRDVFAPLAADLAEGRDPDRLGERLAGQDLVRLPFGEAEVEGNRLEARVLHVDRFGNCVLNIPESAWKNVFGGRDGADLLEPVSVFVTLVRAYNDIPPGSAGLLPGSQGYLELAVDRASCAERLGLESGDRVVLRL
ncbi:MAG: SAM-dependent chlorinase/fluorinase [Desulfohalobiaceae bacterium]|nr:SAM-dependent chlorinase/fluorinase [Desulfohalobiaceae bacterium]